MSAAADPLRPILRLRLALRGLKPTPWRRLEVLAETILSARSETAKAINYSLNHWPAFTRFLNDGRICLSNNAAERALRGIAIGRRNWTFCGSDAGGHRAASIYPLIETAKLNDVDPQAWLAWVLAKLPDHPAKRIDEMLPWNWKAAQTAEAPAKAA